MEDSHLDAVEKAKQYGNSVAKQLNFIRCFPSQTVNFYWLKRNASIAWGYAEKAETLHNLYY